ALTTCALSLSVAGLDTATAQEDDGLASPGDVIDVAPSGFQVIPGVPTPTRAWRIEYRSTSATGDANIVSATVIVPLDGHSGTRPLVSYAVGTVGLADRCAPSATLPHGLNPEGGNISKALLRGWGVVVTDYEGLSTPGTHTYLVSESEGHAVLDAARAARRMSK